MRHRNLPLLPVFLFVFSACIRSAAPPAPASAPPTVEPPSLPALADDISERLEKFPPTAIDYDRSLLDANETAVVAKLIDASRMIEQIFWLQVAEKNPAWRENLVSASRASPRHAEALRLFDIMKGPWDRLEHEEPFVLPAGPKPDGAGFYPADITKAEVEQWISLHPADRESFQGLFTVVRRSADGLVATPYSKQYRMFLEPAAAKLREAAALTKDAGLRDFLNKRADAFATDDYYVSDFAWMDLSGPIEVVIGPYEVYEDNLFNWKAAFESFVTVVDAPESEKLTIYAQHLAGMERNLPMPDVHKNPNRGSDSPIKVVQVAYTAGDARRGVQTAAFNLPNDERVREAKGSKKVLLKNVMEAKYRQSGYPIAQLVLEESQLGLVSFSAFFNQVLFHELSHGVGPGIITGPDGKKIENRLLLKETYSTIEEAKADVLGVWNLFYAIDRKILTAFDERSLMATNAGLMFRSLRFGLGEAHGRGNAIQWNWYREKNAIVPASGGRYRVDFSRMKEAVESLATELLLIEAIGDYERAKRLLDKYGKSNAEIDAMNARLVGIPVDISPIYPAAGERVGGR